MQSVAHNDRLRTSDRRPPVRESGEPHRFQRPDVREMTPAEIEAQRRLVRASLLTRQS